METKCNTKEIIFVPTYATITNSYVEIKLYNKIERCLGTLIEEYLMNNWKRFLDDCEILLKTEKISLEVVLEILNSIYASI